MDPERSEQRLSAAAMLFRCLMWFPVWMMLLSIRQKGADMLLPASGILLLASYVTAVWSRIWRLHFGTVYPWRGRLMTWLMLLPAACGAAYAVYRMTGGITPSVLAAGVPLIFLAVTADKQADTLFGAPCYGAYLALTTGAALFMRIAGVPVPMTVILVLTCVQSGGFFLLRNQFMLRRLVNRRSARETDVPREIRRLNLVLTLVIFGVITVLLLFRAPLTELLRMMTAGAYLAVRFVLQCVYKLINFFGGDTPGYEERPEGNDAALMQPDGTIHPLWLLLWIPILFAAYCVWKVFVSEWVYDIRMALGDWIRRLRGVPEEHRALPAVTEDEAYTDTETRTVRGQSARQAKRTWKKELRQWRKLPDGAEKFYAGYSLLLRAPAWGGDQPRASETVREICVHWAEQTGGGLDAVTADFQAHRYAENALPAGAVAEMEKALRTADSEK